MRPSLSTPRMLASCLTTYHDVVQAPAETHGEVGLISFADDPLREELDALHQELRQHP